MSLILVWRFWKEDSAATVSSPISAYIYEHLWSGL
jgi:hypothetical protein